MATTGEITGEDGLTTRDLIHRITDDVRTLAKDEIELVRDEVTRTAKTAAAEAAAVTFGGIVTLIGFAMLCTAAVVALAPVIHSLAIRLLIMAAIYIILGGALATAFGMKLRRDVVPDLKLPTREAKSVVEGVKATIQERGSQAHA